MKLRIHILVLLTIVLFLSCRNRKTIGVTKLKNLSHKVIIDSLQNTAFNFDWLRTKGSATIHINDDKHTIRTNFRIRKDSAIWNNLAKGPVQISTTLLSQDSVKLLKKTGKKEYFLGDYSFINDMLNIELDFKLLQDFFSGNPVMFDYDSKYKTEIDSGLYLLSSTKSKKIDKLLKKGKINKKHEMLYRCWVDPTNFKCTKIEINMLSTDNSIIVNFSNWKQVDEQDFPLNSSIIFRSLEDTVMLDLGYSEKIKVNVPQTFPFKLTDSYTPFDLDGEN